MVLKNQSPTIGFGLVISKIYNHPDLEQCKCFCCLGIHTRSRHRSWKRGKSICKDPNISNMLGTQSNWFCNSTLLWRVFIVWYTMNDEPCKTGNFSTVKYFGDESSWPFRQKNVTFVTSFRQFVLTKHTSWTSDDMRFVSTSSGHKKWFVSTSSGHEKWFVSTSSGHEKWFVT